MTLKHAAAAALGSLATIVMATPLGAAEPRHVMFILDASNSMWGQIDGRAKIDIAKDVLTSQFANLPAGTQAGLIAYGHRFDRKLNDCTDMELVGGYAEHSPASVRELLAYVTPKGQTPIAATLEESIGWVSKDSNNQPVASPSVVLITDGAESCDGDPCKAADKLASAGIDATVHVVGFDLNDEQRALVGCIAENGNGLYFDARDASGLETALKQVAQAEAAPEPAPAPEPPAAPQPASVLVDDFDGADLASHWSVANPDLDSYIVENGELLLVSSKIGGLDVAETNNILVLDEALPDGDWDATITFTAELKTLNEQIQFGLWNDAQNGLFGTLWTQAGVTNCSRVAALSNTKMSAGETVKFDLPVLGTNRVDCGGFERVQLVAAVAPMAEQTSTIGMHKRGRSYHFTAQLGDRDQGGKPVSYQTEPLTSLRLPGKLAIAIGKRADVQGEVAVMIDKLEIVSVSP